MPINAKKLFLLSYDIANPDRLRQVHRSVRGQGIPLQYSVFLVPGTVALLNSLLGELTSIIDDRVDDIRVYALPSHLDVDQYGRQLLPEGVQILGDEPVSEQIAALVEERQSR